MWQRGGERGDGGRGGAVGQWPINGGDSIAGERFREGRELGEGFDAEAFGLRFVGRVFGERGGVAGAEAGVDDAQHRHVVVDGSFDQLCQRRQRGRDDGVVDGAGSLLHEQRFLVGEKLRDFRLRKLAQGEQRDDANVGGFVFRDFIERGLAGERGEEHHARVAQEFVACDLLADEFGDGSGGQRLGAICEGERGLEANARRGVGELRRHGTRGFGRERRGHIAHRFQKLRAHFRVGIVEQRRFKFTGRAGFLIGMIACVLPRGLAERPDRVQARKVFL